MCSHFSMSSGMIPTVARPHPIRAYTPCTRPLDFLGFHIPNASVMVASSVASKAPPSELNPTIHNHPQPNCRRNLLLGQNLCIVDKMGQNFHKKMISFLIQRRYISTLWAFCGMLFCETKKVHVL